MTSRSGVSTPSSAQMGIIETCNEFYKVVTGDTCYDIAVENEAELSDFTLAILLSRRIVRGYRLICMYASGCRLPVAPPLQQYWPLVSLPPHASNPG